MSSELPQICFGVSIYETDVTYDREEEFRKLNGLIPKKEVRCWPDKTAPNVWAMTDGEPSKVGVSGQEQYRAELRQSTSIRGLFSFKMRDQIKRFFSKIKVGTGSKHIYVAGDFMKEHYDTKLPDLDGLPHIMTLIVTNSIEELRVCGKPVPRISSDSYERTYGVLFTLNCPHEVLPIQYGTRHSFVFPVYGEYKGLTTRPGKESINLYDSIIEALHDKANTPSHLHGWLKSVENPAVERLIIRLRKMDGDYIGDANYGSNEYNGYGDYRDHDDDYSEVEDQGVYAGTYTDEKGETVEGEFSSVFEIPFAKNLSIKAVSGKVMILKKIETLVLEEKADMEAKYKQFLDTEVPPLSPDTEIPSHPFFVQLQGRYLPAATAADLVSRDAVVQKFLVDKGRKVEFVPVSAGDRDYDAGLVFMFHDGKLVSTGSRWSRSVEKFDKLSSSGGYVEFDDQGGYDPHYSRVSGMLVVN